MPILLITCEHAVNTVPEEYAAYFKEYAALLNTHYAIDFGALAVATYLAQTFACHLSVASATRLLIDVNRQLSNPYCFSKITASLPEFTKKAIIQDYYLPFRDPVVQIIRQHISAGSQVWHLSIHSFTPVWHDVVRTADIGFLYDPQHKLEKLLAIQWQTLLRQADSNLRVRLNYPYLGINDGFTRYLRRQFEKTQYLGLEVEVNQCWANNIAIAKIVGESLQQLFRTS